MPSSSWASKLPFATCSIAAPSLFMGLKIQRCKNTVTTLPIKALMTMNQTMLCTGKRLKPKYSSSHTPIQAMKEITSSEINTSAIILLRMEKLVLEVYLIA